jgi:hypothetical protein
MGSAFSRAQSVSPSIRGMAMSSRMRSGSDLSISSSASTPSLAWRTSYPRSASCSSMSSRFAATSSTTSTIGCAWGMNTLVISSSPRRRQRRRGSLSVA